ncbi:MAG: ABC transporter ATP-binding protein [Limnochordaceae bacterium]|nr:ABC transporter ATP-binding protein [Limnochordaceae bacterium]
MNEWSVRTEQLVKVYKMGENEVHALRGVDLQIEKGAFVSVMGRSGSGKSTLLHLIGCLDRPTSGRVYIDGEEVSALPARALPRVRRDKVGFMFQEHNLIPTLTALENVMLPMKYARLPRAQALQRAKQLLDWVGLADRAQHLPSELSGGQQARVALARALANKPALVLADEPTGALDSQTATDVIGLMHRLNQETRCTFVIVTHDPLVAERTTRIYHMMDGQITGIETPNGSVDGVVQDPRAIAGAARRAVIR